LTQRDTKKLQKDIINPDWSDCINVSFSSLISKHAEPFLQLIEARSYSDPDHQNRQIAKISGKTAVLLSAGDTYDWHSDSFAFENRQLSNPRPNRFWTHIIYLTEGKPLEIGNWNPTGNLLDDFSYPEPSEIIARVYPTPGKTITFPCFMVHRIQPTVDNDRWTFVDFITTMKYNNTNSTEYINLAKRYFNEDFRSQLLSS